MSSNYSTQNELLLNKLLSWYNETNNMKKIVSIINGEHRVSLRIIDWFVTNYSKKNYTNYEINKNGQTIRFKVYVDYKLKLKAYSKKRFDPFCRWERIIIPYNNSSTHDTGIQTTLGQLNFFKWALEYNIIDYIEENYKFIESDMNNRNSTAKKKEKPNVKGTSKNQKTIKTSSNKTRKKREELSVSATKSIKKETVEIILKFD